MAFEYTLIDSGEAPARMPIRAKRRNPEVEALVEALAPGKVARIVVAGGVKGRTIPYKIMQSAARRRKVVEVWEVGGVLYAEMVEADAGA